MNDVFILLKDDDGRLIFFIYRWPMTFSLFWVFCVKERVSWAGCLPTEKYTIRKCVKGVIVCLAARAFAFKRKRDYKCYCCPRKLKKLKWLSQDQRTAAASLSSFSFQIHFRGKDRRGGSC